MQAQNVVTSFGTHCPEILTAKSPNGERQESEVSKCINYQLSIPKLSPCLTLPRFSGHLRLCHLAAGQVTDLDNAETLEGGWGQRAKGHPN